MVFINSKAVMVKPTIPNKVSLAAMLENCCMYTVMILPAVSGTRLVSMKIFTCAIRSVNTGNAANTVMVTVISGTSESKVVKVRLAAICAQRSSLKRCATKRTKPSVFFQ